MRKSGFLHLLYFAVIAFTIVTCTDFREEEMPVRFGVDVSELSFAAAASTRSVEVSSGKKWDVTSMPSWLSLQSITQSGSSPYEWIVNFAASPNDEYDRDGLITIKAGSDAAEILVSQEGKKGKFFAVESISVSPTELIVTEGDNASLSFVISPSNASIKDVIWKSSNTSVVTVSQTGQVDAVAEGTALITVTTVDGNKTASCAVTVVAKVIPVTGVSLDKTILTLIEGDILELTATVSPTNATDKSVTWSSSNTSVATISSSGVVTAKSAGSTTITVKTTDGSKTATCTVVVKAKTIAVTGVSLNKTSLTLTVGDTFTLTETVTPSNATDKSVTWSSSNTSVATVSSSGVVTAKAVGTAKITVTTNDGAKTATCSVSVSAATVSVTGVSLNRTSLTLTEGESFTLTATVTPSNATDQSVTWSSSNTSVATVSSAGVILAKAAGSSTITVTTNDGNKTATCSVSVTAATVPVTGVSLNRASLSMGVGETQTLTATVTPSNATDQSVTWSSSNTSVATVTALGVVSARSVGSATITVTTNDGSKTATCTVKVVDYQNYEYIELGLPSGLKWAKYNLGASSPEEPGDRYAWGETETKQNYWWGTYKWCNGSENSLTKYNTNSSYGTVDSRTVLLAADDVAHVKLGGKWRMPTYAEWTELRNYCTWVWTTLNGREGNLVTGPNGDSIFLPSAGIARYPDGASYVGGYYWSSSLQSLYPNKALGVSFYSNNVSTGGGERCYGQSIRPVFEVDKVSVTGVSLNKTSLTMSVGDTQTLTATVTPSNATDKSVTWSSSNTSVAIVSSSGVVTAKAAGTATITVTTNDGGKKATCSVTVKAKTVSVTGISLTPTSLSMTVGDTQTLTATVTPSNATDKSVTWSSSNTSVATVSSFGVVTAKAAGTATITVTTTDGGKKATCSVTVQAQTVYVTGVSLSKTSLSMTAGDTQTLTATVTPSNATDKSVTWSSSNSSVATVSSSGVVTAKAAGSATITVTTNDGGKKATCSVTVEKSTTGILNGHNYVEMGDGLKWATMNVGASLETDYGDYFAWGETEPKSKYSWSNYKYGTESSITKYVTSSDYGIIDNKTVLEAGDDAASVKWGGSWRMPTNEEWSTLRNTTNFTWTWGTKNGVKGYTVTSNIEGYVGNSIFLPAGGCYIGENLRDQNSGYYWSSTLYGSDSSKAWYICPGYVSISQNGLARSCGYSVRAVSK